MLSESACCVKIATPGSQGQWPGPLPRDRIFILSRFLTVPRSGKGPQGPKIAKHFLIRGLRAHLFWSKLTKEDSETPPVVIFHSARGSGLTGTQVASTLPGPWPRPRSVGPCLGQDPPGHLGWRRRRTRRKRRRRRRRCNPRVFNDIGIRQPNGPEAC
eukprot:7262768-Pyramimonas_sp.AAC.3